MQEPPQNSNVNAVWVGVVVEGGLILTALIIGSLGFYDWRQPLSESISSIRIQTLGTGLLIALPLVASLVLFHFWRPAFIKTFHEFVETQLWPLFASSSIVELAIISLMAGIGEELLFRWCVLGGIASTLEPLAGYWPAVTIATVCSSVLFGVCHWVNTTYFWMAFVAGVYFAVVMLFTDSWIVAAIGHAFYDFVALMYLRRNSKRRSADW